MMLCCLSHLSIANPTFLTIPDDMADYHDVPGHIIFSVHINEGKIYLGTNKGLSVSKDFGKTFESITTARGLPGWGIEKVRAEGKQIYVKSLAGKSYLSEDGGRNFNRLAESDVPLFAIRKLGKWKKVKKKDPHSGSKTLSGIRLFDEGGNSASKKSIKYSITTLNLPDTEVMCVHREGKVIVVGTRHGYSTSTDGGKTFKKREIKENPLNSGYLTDLHVAESKLYATSSLGVSVISKGEEHSPSFLAPKKLEKANGIYTYKDKILVSTSQGGLWISKNHGKSFEVHSQIRGADPSSRFNKIRGFEDTVLLSSEGDVPPQLFISRDGGDTFDRTGFQGEGINDCLVQGNHVYVASDSGIYYSSDFGQSFTLILNTHAINADKAKVSSLFVDSSTIYAGTEGGLYVSSNNGRTFDRVTAPQFNVTAVAAAGGKVYFAAIGNSKNSTKLYVFKDPEKGIQEFGHGTGIHGPSIDRIILVNDKVFLMSASSIRVNSEAIDF
jgi:photosystem II stability/assembly factor-like uncharacterized protein